MYPRLLSAVLAFVALATVYSIHSVTSRDPTSLFFNPRTAYAPAYSTIRKEQAEAFITTTANSTDYINAKKNETKKKLCVGIPSIAREGVRYLRDSVGSLLAGLTPEERSEIHFVVFIPHSDPTIHPAYTEDWLPNLTNELLVYDLPEDQLNHVKQMEEEGGLYLEKGIFDYNYVVKACHKQEIPYIAIFEDDIVAMDGWYHRTLAAITEAETLSALKKESPDFLYLRLFYTEEFLGWNSESWGTYLMYSSVAFAILVSLFAYLRAKTPSTKWILTNRASLAWSSLCVTLIALYFALGRATVLPLPAGVNYMPQFGCCAQGFVFPRNKAIELVRYLEERRVGFVDVLTEEYADKNDELRWAITPSVIQHVGRKSSKVDDFGPQSKHGLSVAETIWNFAFEKYSSEQLRREHRGVAQRKKKDS
ncbi:integral membrane protein-like protein [Melanomma pulvis-pyrius CBS 109.77]|uniref:Integral membrane protein-like protein n=1 Tax=Melanomma pulvis-pyrius CBS 109.77 TaxID=1314802 RepID=A0A6A6XGY1_9PLEO|nr:integral membrane protein-like protein [Melanomma pulvis-pyrius CBS 109.77]